MKVDQKGVVLDRTVAFPEGGGQIGDKGWLRYELIMKNESVSVYAHDKEKEAWYWKCTDFICPCGGTHVTRTGQIGSSRIRRKKQGGNLERLIAEFEKPVLQVEDYQYS